MKLSPQSFGVHWTPAGLGTAVLIPFAAMPALSDPLYDPGGLPPYDTSRILENEDRFTPDGLLESGVGDDLSEALDTPADAAGLPGLNFGLAYTSVMQSANRSLGRNNASGGDLDLFGSYTYGDAVWERKIVFRLEWQHRFGAIAPADLADEIGAGLNTTTFFFGEQNPALVELFWETYRFRDGFGVRLGRQDPGAFFNTFTWADPDSGFMGEGVVGAAIPMPDLGLGATLRFQPSPSTYVHLGIHDANAKPTDFGFDTVSHGQFYYGAEVGFKPAATRTSGAPGKYSLLLWARDKTSDPTSSSGKGIAFSAEQALPGNTNIVPFARLSLSDGAAAVKQQASVGVVFQNVSQRNDDVIGIAASWMDPADPAFRDETTLEAFWRIHLTPEIAITPSIQYIRNPAKTTAYDSTTVASLRVRFLF